MPNDYTYSEVTGKSTPNTTYSQSEGFPQHMTGVERDALSSPATGLFVYYTTSKKLNFYNGTAWQAVTSA